VKETRKGKRRDRSAARDLLTRFYRHRGVLVAIDGGLVGVSLILYQQLVTAGAQLPWRVNTSARRFFAVAACFAQTTPFFACVCATTFLIAGFNESEEGDAACWGDFAF